MPETLGFPIINRVAVTKLNEDDTFRKLSQTPFYKLIEILTSRYISAEDVKDILFLHGWKLSEFENTTKQVWDQAFSKKITDENI